MTRWNGVSAETLCRLLERAIDARERTGGQQVNVRIELERKDDENAPQAKNRRDENAPRHQCLPHDAAGPEQHDPRIRADERRRHECEDRKERHDAAAADLDPRHAKGHRRSEHQRAEKPAEPDNERIHEGRSEARRFNKAHVVCEAKVTRIVLKTRQQHRSERRYQEGEQDDPGAGSRRWSRSSPASGAPKTDALPDLIEANDVLAPEYERDGTTR